MTKGCHARGPRSSWKDEGPKSHAETTAATALRSPGRQHGLGVLAGRDGARRGAWMRRDGREPAMRGGSPPVRSRLESPRVARGRTKNPKGAARLESKSPAKSSASATSGAAGDRFKLSSP